MSDTKSDTPRTEKLTLKHTTMNISHHVYREVVEHAEQLERELADVTAERDDLKRLSEIHGWRKDCSVDDDIDDILSEFNNDTYSVCHGIIEEREKHDAITAAVRELLAAVDEQVKYRGEIGEEITEAAQRVMELLPEVKP